MLNTFNLPLLTSTISTTFLIWLIVVDALLVLLVILRVIFNFAKKSPKAKVDNNEWFTALGGKENVKEITAVGSRLSLVLNDKEIVDREKLKTLGVSSVVVMSNKMTLVIEGKAERIAETLKGSL